jgi:hypothetical protein
MQGLYSTPDVPQQPSVVNVCDNCSLIRFLGGKRVRLHYLHMWAIRVCDGMKWDGHNDPLTVQNPHPVIVMHLYVRADKNQRVLHKIGTAALVYNFAVASGARPDMRAIPSSTFEIQTASSSGVSCTI